MLITGQCVKKVYLYVNKNKKTFKSQLFKMTSLIHETQRSLFTKFANTVRHIVVLIFLIASSIFILSPAILQYPYRQYSWENSIQKIPKSLNLGYVLVTCKFALQKLMPKRTLCLLSRVVTHYLVEKLHHTHPYAKVQ